MKTVFFDTREWSHDKLQNTGNALYYGSIAALIATIPLMFVDFGLSAVANLLLQLTAGILPLVTMHIGENMLEESMRKA